MPASASARSRPANQRALAVVSAQGNDGSADVFTERHAASLALAVRDCRKRGSQGGIERCNLGGVKVGQNLVGGSGGGCIQRRTGRSGPVDVIAGGALD